MALYSGGQYCGNNPAAETGDEGAIYIACGSFGGVAMWRVTKNLTATSYTNSSGFGYYGNVLAVGPNRKIWFASSSSISELNAARDSITTYPADFSPSNMSALTMGPNGSLYVSDSQGYPDVFNPKP